MTAVHGSNGTLTINSGALTGFTTDMTLSRTADTAESTVFGLTSKTYIPGLKDATLDATLFYDKTTTTGSIYILEAVYAANAAVACVFRPAGGTSNEYTYGFNAILTTFDIAGAVGDIVSVNVSLQVTGAVTPGTI